MRQTTARRIRAIARVHVARWVAVDPDKRERHTGAMTRRVQRRMRKDWLTIPRPERGRFLDRAEQSAT